MRRPWLSWWWVPSLVGIISRRWHTPAADVLAHAADTVLVVGVLGYAAAGCRRRRPYWTHESWWPFALRAAGFAALIGLSLAMAGAVDAHFALAGPGQSLQRAAWVVGMIIVLLSGAIGLILTLDRLWKGDPSQPFTS